MAGIENNAQNKRKKKSPATHASKAGKKAVKSPKETKPKKPKAETGPQKPLDPLAPPCDNANNTGAGGNEQGLSVLPPSFLPPELEALTPQEINFCEEYLISSNGTQAALKAGYSPTENYGSASCASRRLLENPAIKAYLRVRKELLVRNRVVNVDFLVNMLLETYGKAQVAVPVMEFDYATKQMVPTGEYTFDGRTAVAAVLAIARLKGYDKAKDGGTAQRPFNIAIILNKYHREAAVQLAEHAGIEPPLIDQVPNVPGLPRIQIRKPKPGGGNGTGQAG